MIPSPSDTRASLILRLPDAADAAAWDELTAIYGPLVFRMAVRQGMQAADADDLVQNVFAAIARSVAEWLERPDRGKFRAWLLRIARNAAVNFLTRRGHRPLGTGDDQVAQMLAQVPAPESQLSSEFDLEYRREVFHWAAEKVRDTVADTTWQSFWLTEMENLPVVEAAEQLNISVGNVYIGRSRVMTRLKELVKQFEEVT
jgi:RNA polymerase sigma-70 factor, ECF subfamily